MSAVHDEEIAIDPVTYPQEQDIDEQRRAYVLECMTACGDAPSIDGRIFVSNLNMVTEWLKSGALPEQKRPRAVAQPAGQP